LNLQYRDKEACIYPVLLFTAQAGFCTGFNKSPVIFPF
jgi:hypothetical protein